jgi:RNA polymerase sigma factor (sigma-70 family)
MPSAPADATLLAQARLGRTDAFEALVVRHQSLVCAITFSMLGDRGLSEDVAQDTFLAAWRARSEVREPESFRAWLCSTARNLALKARRRLGRTAELVDRELPDGTVALEDELAARESEATVWRALEAVPIAYREPLVLYYREGRSAAQVAELLGLSVAAVEQRLSRGRKHLKQEVEALVERTLERSRPSSGFAAGVMAALPLPAAPAATDQATSPTATTTESARSGSTSMITTLTKTLAVAGMMSILAVAAHAAVTERAPDDATAATSTSATLAAIDAKPAAPDATSAAPDAKPIAESPASTAPRPDARAEREDLADARSKVDADAAAPAAAATPAAGAYEVTRLAVDQVTVALEGGPSRLTTFGPTLREPPQTLRTLRGRVLDEAGQPVAGAVVVAGSALRAMLGNSLSTDAGTTTGPDGSYALALWKAEPVVVLALHRDGWSPITPVAKGTDDLSLELHLHPTAALRGTITRGGVAQEAEVLVSQHGASKLYIRVPTDAKGRYRIDRLPPGKLEVKASLSHDAGLGTGALASRSVTLVSGKARRIDLDLPQGAHVTVESDVPEGVRMMQYTLLVGEHAVSNAGALARLRKELPAEETRTLLYGGSDLDEVMQWSDVPHGAVTLCVEALKMRDQLWGLACTVTEVGTGGEAVHEVRLQPVAVAE